MVVCVSVPVPWRRNTYIPNKRHDSSQADPSYYFILCMLCCHYGSLALAVKSIQVQQLFQSVTLDSLTAVLHGLAILNVKFMHTCTAVLGMLAMGANGSHSKRNAVRGR